MVSGCGRHWPGARELRARETLVAAPLSRPSLGSGAGLSSKSSGRHSLLDSPQQQIPQLGRGDSHMFLQVQRLSVAPKASRALLSYISWPRVTGRAGLLYTARGREQTPAVPAGSPHAAPGPSRGHSRRRTRNPSFTLITARFVCSNLFDFHPPHSTAYQKSFGAS